jgi:uncharacterized membrane protein YccC
MIAAGARRTSSLISRLRPLADLLAWAPRRPIPTDRDKEASALKAAIESARRRHAPIRHLQAQLTALRHRQLSGPDLNQGGPR